MELRVSNEADELSIQNFDCSNTEAEQSLLGMIMVNPDVFPRVKSFLQPNDFYATPHKRIYSAMLDLYLDEMLPELGAVANQLKVAKQLEGVGGVSGLNEIQMKACMPIFLEQTCRIIWEHSEKRKARRNLLNTLEKLQAGAHAKDVAESVRREFLRIGRDRKAINKSFSELLADAETTLVNRMDNPAQRGLRLGYHKLDEIVNGIEPGEMVLVGARPSMGKTMLAQNFAMNLLEAGKRVVFLSLEMSKEALIFRLVSRKSEIHLNKFRSGDLSQEEMLTWYDSIASMAEYKLHLFENRDGITTLDGIEAKLAEIEDEEPFDVLILDYLGLLRLPEDQHKRFGSKHQIVDEFSKGIKTLLQKLRKPGIILCQLSRALRERQDKRPQLSDLRESGSLEEDADIVMFLHRESYYDREVDSNIAEVIVAKHRNGSLGTAYLTYMPEVQTFVDGPESDSYQPQKKRKGGSTYAANATKDDGE